MSGYSDSSSYPNHPNLPANQQRQFGLGHQSISYSPQTPTQNNQPPPLPQQQQSLYQHNGPNGHNGHNGHNFPPNEHDMQQQAFSVPSAGPATPAGKNGQPKHGRLGRACDLCSQRKVKCDNNVPCKPCLSLDLPCTKARESKRRGPPNKHAEAIKKQNIGSSSAGIPAGLSPPVSPNNVAETLASFSAHAVLNAESILPFPTLRLLVDDFFTYIHPLAPFPHETSFRQAFFSRQDLSNKRFLALLASMIGALVASFPRKPKLHLKAQNLEYLFPSSLSLVERCHKVAVEARGAGYLDGQLDVWDAVTSYFLGLAAAYTVQWPQSRLYFGETLNISRVVGAHNSARRSSDGEINPFGTDEPEPVDYIKLEIGRRVFWIMLASVRSLNLIGGTYGELFIPPPTVSHPYPPFPAEVDDEFILMTQSGPQPPGLISKLTGFNVGIKIYHSLSELGKLELCYGIDEVFDWAKQKKVLDECLNSVRNILATLPPELKLQPASQLGQFESSYPQYYPRVADYPVPTSGDSATYLPPETAERRKLQFDIQKANIYASGLATRSYIVEKYGNLQEAAERSREAQPTTHQNPPTRSLDDIVTDVTNERETIVKDFLHVLQNINQVDMEPNGPSFINKIRQVASTLVGQPRDRKGPMALKSAEYLKKCLDVLLKLEGVTPAKKSDAGELGGDEEEELRSWADLRENQMRFAQVGGFTDID